MSASVTPAMLRFFLNSRAFALESFARTEAGQASARQALSETLTELTGLPDSMIRAAFAGRLTDAPARAAIWTVLGHFPARNDFAPRAITSSPERRTA